MKKLVTMFIDSAKEFTKLKSLVTAAFLVAVHTVLALFVSIQVTDSLRISVSFAANLVIGAFFGPVMGFVWETSSSLSSNLPVPLIPDLL